MSAIVELGGAFLRERRADSFHYAFILLHLAGLSMLTLRSAELREWAFIAINAIGILFWLFVLCVKALALPIPPSAAVGPTRT